MLLSCCNICYQDEKAVYLNFTQDDRSNIFNEKRPSVA